MLRRELQPSRPHPLLYVACVAVVAFLGAVGCAAAFTQCAAPRPACDSASTKPAIACRGATSLVYRACRWQCVSWFDIPALEQSEWTLYVPDRSGNLTPVKAVR